MCSCFFFQAEDGIRDRLVTGVQTCALPIFPNDYSHRYRLSVGSKLLTINCYYCQFTEHADLSFGPGHTGQWTGFFPLIADFLSGDRKSVV